MINNVFLKKKTKRGKMYVNIDEDSGEVLLLRRDSSEGDPVGVVTGAH